jgi:hypothetical protein
MTSGEMAYLSMHGTANGWNEDVGSPFQEKANPINRAVQPNS